MFRVNVAPPAGLDKLAKDLKRAGGPLRKDLTAALRKETTAVKRAITDAIEDGDYSASRVPGATKRFPRNAVRSKGLRKPLMRAVDSKVSTSAGGARAEVTIRPSKVPLRIRALIPYLTGQKPRLRHPLPGTRSAWVGQRFPAAWTKGKQLAPRAQKAAGQVLDHTAAIIAGRK